MSRSKVLTVTMGALILCAVTALAVPAGMLQGKPNFEIGDDFGYFFWHDQDGLHLRWTTKGKARQFSGTVQSDRSIDDLKRLRLEGQDWVVRTGPKSFRFNTTTDGHMDGVDFRSPGAEDLKLFLEVDGHAIAVQHIHLGARSGHPQNNPFVVRR